MLIQLIVRNADLSGGKARIALPLYAQCDIAILSVQYSDTDNSQHTHLIQVRSDVLTFTASPTPYLTFIAQAGSNQITFADTRIHMRDVILNGIVTIEPINLATGLTPANFGAIVITLEITPKK